jgi:hypothetical protein
VPPGDHPVLVEHLARRLVQIVAAALTDLDTVVSVHGDAAPISTAHVRRHLAVVAAETLGCLEEWPS